MSTAEKIRQARLKKGWTQDEFARELGVGVRNVSRWELGQATPRAKAMRRIAEVTGVALDDLLAVEEVADAAQARALENLTAAVMAVLQGATSEALAKPAPPAEEPPRFRGLLIGSLERPWADPSIVIDRTEAGRGK